MLTLRRSGYGACCVAARAGTCREELLRGSGGGRMAEDCVSVCGSVFGRVLGSAAGTVFGIVGGMGV